MQRDSRTLDPRQVDDGETAARSELGVHREADVHVDPASLTAFVPDECRTDGA